MGGSLNDPDSYTPPHYYDDYYRHQSERLQFDGSVSYEWSASNRLELGAEYRRYTMRQYYDMFPTDPLGNTNSQYLSYYGYDISGSEVDSNDWIHGVRRPRQTAFWLSDRWTHSYFTLSGSLRLDLLDYNEMIVINPGNPFDPDYLGGDDGWRLDSGDVQESGTHWCWSPGLELMAAPTDWLEVNGKFSVSYKLPPYGYVLMDFDHFEATVWNFSLNEAWSRLKPFKTTAFEVGGTAHPLERVSIGAKLYYAKYTGLMGVFTYSKSTYAYATYQNNVESRAWGGDFTVAAAPTDQVKLLVMYTVQTANDYQRMPNYWGQYAGEVDMVEATGDKDQPHAFSGLVDFKYGDAEGQSGVGALLLSGVKASVLFQYSSGLPYTPTSVYDAVTFASVSIIPNGEINSERMPSIFTLDLMLQKEITLGRCTLTPYLWVKNLFNRENIVYVYRGTGEADNTGYLSSAEGQAKIEHDSPYNIDGSGLTYEQKYNLAQRDPVNFAPPRQIMFGLRMSL